MTAARQKARRTKKCWHMARSVLVVEDDHNIADLLRMYLEKEGSAFVLPPDGGTALQEFAKAAPDLILLDVMLPVLDGWSVLSRVREASANRQLCSQPRGNFRQNQRPQHGC